MHPLPVHFADRLIAFIRRLRDDRRGNVLLMTGAAIPLLLLAVGFGIDYARAQRLQTKLDAAADAAALASVDPTLLSKSSSDVKGYVETMFDEQVKGLNGLTVLSRSATVNDNASGSLGTLRKTTFTYTATSTNIFGSILRMTNLAIGGTSVASASQPPSMNFFIAMDNSPSMLLPTTTAGINNLTAAVSWKGEKTLYGQVDGCDFACHATDMQTWNQGVYVIDSNKYPIYTDASNSSTFYRVSCSGNVYDQNNNLLGSNASITTTALGKGSTATYCSGYGPSTNPVYIYYLPSGKNDKSSNYISIAVNFPDTFWLVQNYGLVNPGSSPIALRTDAERDAAVSVINYAYNLEQQYAATNIPPVYQMQFYTFNALGTAAPLSTAPFGTMTDVASLNGGASFPTASSLVPQIPASGAYTSFTSMLTTMKGKLPSSAGTGTKASPQSVLIIITDGAVDDGTISQLSTANITQCTQIKNAGTRIAILYTEYLAATINYTAHPTFNTFAKNNLPYVQQQLQACASQNADGTYLMQTVSTNGDVSAALNTLFAMAVQSARLVQ